MDASADAMPFPEYASRHLETAVLFSTERPLLLASGHMLTDVRVAYERYGRLDLESNNTVFVCHALTGDSHMAQHDARDLPGWWDAMVGPGRPIDTNIFHVVSANVLGGCAGTTGPWSNAPGGHRYATSFPEVTVADMVTVHRALLAHLGISRLYAVVGGSLGGMQALEWLLRYPCDARKYFLIATTARLSADNLAFNAIGRAAIRSDPRFADGHYPLHAGPDGGLGIARMVGHMTYMSASALEAKFGRHIGHLSFPAIRASSASVSCGPYAVERYLEHQAEKLAARFDANSYLYLIAAMDHFDAFAEQPRTASDPGPDVHVFSFASDRLFGLEHSLRLRDELSLLYPAVTHFHDRSSCAGHDAFLLPVPAFLSEIERHLRPSALPRRTPLQPANWAKSDSENS